MSVVIASTSDRRRPYGRRLVAVLGTLAAPFILYLVLRAAIVGLNPAAAGSLPPVNYTGMLNPLLTRFMLPKPALPEQLASMAKSSAVGAPLEFAPFYLLAKAAADRGDTRRAILLMEEARRRGHNEVPTRLMLMGYYAQARRYEEALAEMDYALRSEDALRQPVLPELVKVVREPEGRRALAPMLARQPNWRPDFIRVADTQGIRPKDALELLELVRASRPTGDFALERGLYLQALVRGGEVREARSAWLQSFPEAQRQSYRHLFDGAFAAPPAPQPFGWLLHDMDAGRAEIVRSGGRGSHLEVNYFGGKSAVLAEQRLALTPGSYRLSFVAKSDGGVPSGELAWSISCLPEGPELGKVVVKDPQAAPRKYEVPFRVSGCSGQSLRLVAEPGDVAAAFTVQVSQMQVTEQ